MRGRCWRPTVFRNTELVFNNDLAHFVGQLGFAGIICEGADHLLGYRSPNYVYQPPGGADVRLLLKNYRLSDDVAFRFSNRDWPVASAVAIALLLLLVIPIVFFQHTQARSGEAES